MPASSSSFTRSLLLALPMTFGTALAIAQQSSQDLQRVEVSGRRPGEIARLDVKASCPGIAQSLQESLAATVNRQGEAGTMRVQFRVKGDSPSEVRHSGGPQGYRQPVRRAMHNVGCAAREDGQLFTFMLVFTPEDAREQSSPNQNVAMLEQ
jgi:hypothetical protein